MAIPINSYSMCNKYEVSQKHDVIVEAATSLQLWSFPGWGLGGGSWLGLRGEGARGLKGLDSGLGI